MNAFPYAFKLLDDAEERVMRLTVDEFELLFGPHPTAAKKALAYYEFSLVGVRLCRVPADSVEAA
jgi:hypothetical protein